MSTKTEIQSRIKKCESELATLKDDLAKCEDGIEEEKCWHAMHPHGYATSGVPRTKKEVEDAFKLSTERPAYMPECRQVTAEDIRRASKELDELPSDFPSAEEQAKALHKLGFRIKVTP